MARRIEELDRNLKPAEISESKQLRWFQATDKKLTVRGLPWFDENGGRFSRVPLRAEGTIRDAVWTLAQCPSSGHLAFRTDATSMAVRVTNRDAEVMRHMPSTGSRGLILYSGAPQNLRPWSTAIPEPGMASWERPLFENLPVKMREFRLYLPLYKELVGLELGLSKGARILPPSPLAVSRPVVFYGTSITQGGCASTAGSDYVSRVGRLLNIEAVNLGFSGNGKGEPEIAELLTEIDASLYVLDYASNVDAAGLRRTLPRFVKILREKRPEVPILLVTNINYSAYDYLASRVEMLEQRRDIMMEFYIKQRKSGNRLIHLVDGFGLLPFGTDCAYVDGVHPTDHGFHLMAERIAPFIEQIILNDSCKS
jgi:lysophospholipase L1-like esterase